MGGAQVLLQTCVLIPLQGSDCAQVTIPWSDLKPMAQGAPSLRPAPTATLALLPVSSLSAQRMSAASQLPAHVPPEPVSALNFTSHIAEFPWLLEVQKAKSAPASVVKLPKVLAVKQVQHILWLRPKTAQQIWDEHEFWNKFKTVYLGFVAGFVGWFFLVGWAGLGFLFVFYQYDTTPSLSNERTAEPSTRQCLTLSRTGLRAARKDSMEKILLCVCTVLPLRKEKTHPTCCRNDFYLNLSMQKSFVSILTWFIQVWKRKHCRDTMFFIAYSSENLKSSYS